MKQNQDQTNTVNASPAPSPEEIARHAYFAYLNEGSLPGHDVQHWLHAEAKMLAERERTRVHGFHKNS